MRPAKGDDANFVALLVGILKQAEHGSLDGLHALPRRHGAGRIDHEQNDGARPAYALLAMQIVARHGDDGAPFAFQRARVLRSRLRLRARSALAQPDSPTGHAANRRGAQRGIDRHARRRRVAHCAHVMPLAGRWHRVPPTLLRRFSRVSLHLQDRSHVRRRRVEDLFLRTARCRACFRLGFSRRRLGLRRRAGCSLGSCERRSSSRCRSRPGCSNGLRRRRCGSANSAAVRMSSAVTSSATVPRRQRSCRLVQHQVGTQTIDLELAAEPADEGQQGVTQRHRRKKRPRGDDALRSDVCSSLHLAAKAAPSLSNAMRRRTTSAPAPARAAPSPSPSGRSDRGTGAEDRPLPDSWCRRAETAPDGRTPRLRAARC